EEALSFAPGCTNHRWEPMWHADLTAEYYDNLDLSGEPVFTEKMASTEAFWVPPFADGKVDAKRFSARISGTYVAGVSGVHRFGIYSAGFSKMFVDGELVADAHTNWTKGRTVFEEGCDEVVGEKVLEAGKSYTVSIEFVAKEDAVLVLSVFRAGIGVPMGDAEIAEAARVAGEAETAVVFVGRSGEWDTEGSDLENIALPGRQDELVAAVCAANPRTVVVLQTGGPVEMPWLDDVAAVLQAWYPGQEAGNAIADVLFGDAEPGGRLPQSFPEQWQDNPTWSQDPEVYPGLNGKVRYEEEVFIGYRHYTRHGIKPLFPFGYGLSYTSFALSGFSAEATGDGAKATATLTNTGDRKGSTVVQIYVGDRESSVLRPLRELKTFAKVELEPGESREVSFALDARAFAFFDEAARMWQVEAGTFTLEAGFSAEEIVASAEIELAAATLKP
ncbi:MAG: glycoside hydrolase family 3 C-terminal domain-containing protein, partial [Maritimibacter sp.]